MAEIAKFLKSNTIYKGWCDEFDIRLNIIIGIVQKRYKWPSCPFTKLIPLWVHHFGKGQLDHSYTFWIIPIIIFSLLSNSLHHPLVARSTVHDYTVIIYNASSLPKHSAYTWNTACWNIKWLKCAGMGLNGFIFKEIIKV